MSEEDKGFGPWSKVPQWDGRFTSWRKFKRDVSWWVSSIDLAGTAKYNLAARFLLRQDGVARQRGEEFTPADLAYRPAETFVDPDTGDEVEVSPPDYLAGLNKLLSAWESMTGQTALDKRGELRQTFYLDLQRRAGERVSEFATRFRSLVADLRAEGVQLHDNELGRWLKQKLGLDALRKQLLETALAGSEDYALIETEVLRLFRDLHEQDPLKRRFEPGTPKLTIRRLFQHQHRGPSSSSSVAPSSMKSFASSVSSRAPSFRSAQSYRQANVTEILEEDDAEDADGGVDGEVGEQIEEVLQSEAEILACELEEAEAEGVDPNLIENLESGIEAAAETLVTMREARQQLASVRKDRGYGKFADGKDSGKKGSSQVQARKTSGKHPCFDCNQLGHWAGDAECTKPGAGLGRRGASAKKSAKQVRIAETSRPSAEHSADITETVSGLPMHDVLVTEELPVDHDVLVVAAGPEALNLEQALAQNLTRSALVSDQQSPLPADKELVGALDSACNRTCTGTVWLEQYLAALKNAPKFVQDLIHCEPESENFRFGNNGVVPSIQRWRLPTLIGQTLVLIWVSLVPIGTLGCLIGRDFMEAVGAVLDFSRRTMTCSLFYSGTLKLRQMVAGHFMLDLLPSRIAEWGAPPQCRWRRVGQDGILELQMDRKSWTKHKLQAQVRRTHEHEHQLTEQAIQASSFTTHVDHDVLVSSSSDGMTADNLLAPVAQARCDRSCDGERRLVSSSSRRMSSMAKVHPSHTGSKGLASEGHRSQPRSKARIALLALSISCCQIVCRLACAGGVYDDQSNLAPPSFGDLFDQDDHYSSWGMPSNSRPRGLQAGIPGRCSDEHGHWYGHWLHWSTSCSSEGSSKGRSRRSSTSSSPGPTASDVEGAHWTPWRPPNVARRSSQVGHDPSHPCRGQGHGADFTHQVSTSSDGLDGWSEDRDTVCSWNGCVEGSSSTCCFEVLTADAGKIRADNRDLVDHGCQRASDGCGWRAGGQLVGSVAGLTNKSNGSSDQSRVNDFRFKWKHKPKPGVQQMISQAWDRHCRDRTAVSKDRHFEVMLEQWNHEVQLGMNEIFLAVFQFPDPFVMEVYTDVEPIAREARRRGLRAAKSMTLHTGWDFRNKSSRVQALKWIRENKPYAVILAFPCGPWSTLMHLNDKTNIQKLRGEAKELVLFAIEVAKLQLSQNCHFLIENPQGSAAWLLDEMIEFLEDPRLRVVVVDQCRFGLCNDLGELHKKPTRLATSSQALISLMLNKRCTGDHSHAPVIGGSKVTRPAGHYSLQFAKAVVSGFMMQFDHETKMLNQDPEPSFEALTAEGLPSSSLAVDGGLSGSDDEIIDAEVGQKKAIIPSSIRAAVMRLHRNTGHRSGRRLARALVLCGAPPEAVLAAKMIQCDECSERRAPKTRRPATLPSVSDVGAQAHIDIVMLEDAFKQIYPVIHVVDKVSRYQMASVMPNKTTAEVVKFLTASWIPLMGRPQILVADQGREFLSYEFEEFCGSRSIFLYHVGVQCPWQNGICERAGASLKAITGAPVRAHSIGGYDEMAMSVGEATAAYNADINEEGVSPLQAVTGRQQPAQGDVLSGVGSRLAEHSLIDSKPTLARQVALRETARVAMVRMHFSRGLRRAELARARTTSLKDFPQPGDLCYFWRASKYNPKKKGAPQSRRKLELRRWFGPALMVAVERSQDGEAGANCFLSFRGQLTKCGLEHVRKASSLEQISFEAWEEAIKDVIHAAGNQPDLDEIPVPAARDGDDDGSDYEPSLVDDETPFPQESHDASGAQESPAELEEVEPLPLTQAEMMAFMQPGLASSRGTSVIPSTIGSSRRSSLASAAPAAEQSTAQPGTPVPSGSSSIAGTSP
jgi:transposase InsO family protein